MPGLFSFDIKGAEAEIDLGPGMKAIGEFVLGRLDGDTIKYYNHLIAVTDSWVYFSKPIKRFTSHHVDANLWSGSESAFGHAYRVLPCIE